MKKKVRLAIKKISSVFIVISFMAQPLAAFADTTADPSADAAHKPIINEVNQVTVVDIAAPNANGLSHNLYTDFNVNVNGLVLNNALQSTNSVLAGTIQANANLQGSAANIIVNEVTGSNRTNLNGRLEVAGPQAAVIIANPNGITGDGFGFINTSRVSLVTGTPNIDDSGNLASFNVNRGDVAIQGQGLSEDNPATKLDILTRASKINAEVWADEIHVVTGTNKINYPDLTTSELSAAPLSDTPSVALDVGAVGGMYAGKIMLIGTEKGLGVSVNGEISADKELSLTNEGKITINGNINAKEDVTISSKDSVVNNGQITSNKNVTISADQITSSGFISAGDEDDEEDEDGNSGAVSIVPADATLTAAGNIDVSGAINASRDIVMTGKKVTYDPNRMMAQNTTVHQSDPDPVEPEPENPDPGNTDPKPPEEQPVSEVIPNTIQPELPDIPDLPVINPAQPGTAATRAVAKEEGLTLTADAAALNIYKPMIDRTASGIDLVQIATPSASGVSRNLYTDFNVKSSGLILNNATQYAYTQLGGYIDYNSRLAGTGASVILNEVTGNRSSSLNGFIEVAGNRASIVIANPNGMVINGLGYINTANATLATGLISTWQNGNVEFYPVANGNIWIQGDGLNAAATEQLTVITNAFANTASELWANHLSLSANGDITNNGKMIMSGNTAITGNRLANTAQGVIDSAGTLDVQLKDNLENNRAMLNSGKTATITAKALSNTDSSVLHSGGDLHLTLDGDLSNQGSQVTAGGQAVILADNLRNNAGAAVVTGKDLTLEAAGDVLNQASAVQSGGNLAMHAKSFSNQDNAAIFSGDDLTVAVKNDIENHTSTISAGGKAQLSGKSLQNTGNALLYAGGDMGVTVDHAIQNDKSTVKSDGSSTLQVETLSNQNGAYLSAKGNLEVTATDSVVNQGSLLNGLADAKVTTGTFSNQDGAVLQAKQNIMLQSTGEFTNQAAAVKADGDLTIMAADIVNRDHALIHSGEKLTLTAEKDVTNQTSVLESGDALTATMQNLTIGDKSVVTSGKNLQWQASADIVNANSTVKSGGAVQITGQNLSNDTVYFKSAGDVTINLSEKLSNKNTTIAVDGNTRLKARNMANQAGSAIFTDKNLTVDATETIDNQNSVMAAGGFAQFNAANLNNTDNAMLYSSDDMEINAQDNVLNQSSSIQSQKDIRIKAQKLVNEKTIFNTDWNVKNQNISYAIPPIAGHYSANRNFAREIKTGTIQQETATAQIAADHDITIDAAVVNHYSTITAGHDLTITGPSVENYGYQGTIITTDKGNDNHFWKYKHHSKHHLHCHWVYGTTVIPYYAQTVVDTDTARLGVLSGVNKVTVVADTIDNKTFDAGKNVIQRDAKKAIEPNVLSQLTNKEKGKATTQVNPQVAEMNTEPSIGSLAINTQIFSIHTEPSAKYLIETNEKFANYHNFLSSDYLLERIKTNPEKVMKRLGDGYYEQQLVTEQITEMTGKKLLTNYGSELEQYKALMENAAVFADTYNLSVGVALTKEQMALLTSDIVWLVEEEINGEKVLVPEVYLAGLKEGDLTNSGAIITGTDVELIAKDDLKNVGTIKADKNLTVNAKNITNENGTITADDLKLTAKQAITNSSGTISGSDVSLQADTIVNQTNTRTDTYRELEQTKILDTASITAGNNLTLRAEDSITNRGAQLSAGKELILTAKKDIDIESVSQEKHVAVSYAKSSAEENDVAHIGSSLGGTNVTISGQNINIKGSGVAASDTIQLTATHDVNITAEKDLTQTDASVGQRGGYYFNRQQNTDETVAGSSIAAGKGINVDGQNIVVKGSGISSETGKINLTADQNVTITNETERHESLHEEHREKTGFLSSTKTDIYDYQSQDKVKGSSLSGHELAVTANENVTVQGSSAVADQDVTLKATTGNINIEAAEEISRSDYEKSVKKSGLFSGGGIGFTIGKQSQKSTNELDSVSQAGSVVGSTGGNVTLEAGKDVAVTASDIISGQDTTITGQNVTIQAADNIDKEHDTYQFKQSGLSVSLGGRAIDNIQAVYQPAKRATEVEDSRLKALYDYKAVKAVDNLSKGKNADGSDPKGGGLSVSVSLGTTKQQSETNAEAVTAAPSQVTAGGDVNITATGVKDKDGQVIDGGDLNIIGSTVDGKNIHLKAANDVNLIAADNTTQSETTNSGKSASIGVSLSQGQAPGFFLGGNKSKGNENGNTLTHTNTQITATDTVTIESGEDTNLKGAQVKGKTVNVKADGDLNLESLQDEDNYKETNKSAGATINFGAGGVSGIGSASKGKINSEYQSVTEQTGIYAGEGGFDIQVGQNTDLKGAVISSEATPDKNKLSTDTLTYSDIENHADYSASSVGVNLDTRKYSKDDPNYKNQGLTPDIGVPAKGSANSTTKSAIASGTVDVRSNPNQDISSLNRDTTNVVNTLGKIFDKKSVQEKQELSKLFGELAYEEVHKISDRAKEAAQNELNKAQADANSTPEQLAALQAKVDSWDTGGSNKTALHALVGGIMSDLGGNSFASGAAGAGVNEAVQKELSKITEPDLHQWASVLVGTAAAKTIGGNGQSGASTGASGTKNNELSGIVEKRQLSDAQIEMYEKMQAELEESKTGATDFMREYQDLASWLYVDDKAVAAAGAYGTEYAMDTKIASMLLNHALYGNGEAMHFGFGESVSADLTNSAILKNGIKKAAADLSPGQTKYVYASIDYNQEDENKNAPSLDQKLAYGNLKVAIQITRDENNNISFYGQAGDAYNFEYHNYVEKIESVKNQGLKEIFKAGVLTLINNGAVAYQNTGALQPFTWTADIQGMIAGG
ncbi:two-partner secretion domain-containing protein [Propionispora vibrioides]|uniref:Haemagluttinin repeat-containing protein n=1 Tax=Propionispora vibrioides TaxID=112903 RepID=A0A1H8WIH5_9FIRM|nr:hemagglutinin repeat-containing protein [Propionispora vibrioides]SEP27465.1 Haemagluttinin repeat-containing protein [Propionispora vibrioides]